MFDPYRKWLGIPDGQRPPTHYQLLGIAPDERDRDVINAAVVRQSAFVRNFQAGEHSEEATRLLNEIAAAKICLLDSAKRAEYDARINQAAKPKPANQSGAHQDLRSSSLLAPPRPAPAPARSQAMLTTPLERPYSPRVTRPAPPAPALSSPSGIWSDVEPLPATRRNARFKPASKKPPAWLWALPAGSCGLVVIILLAVTLSRRPTDATVSQLDPPPEVPSAVVNVDSGAAVAPFASSPTSSPTVPPAASFNSPPPPVAAPVAVQPPVESTSPQADDDDDEPFQPSSTRSSSTPAGRANDPANESSVDVEGPSWSDGSTLSITVPRDAAFTFARANGPFVAVGGTVYSLRTGEPAGRAVSVPRFNALTSLSADGKYFATADASTLDVRDCKSGNTLETWQGIPSLSFIEFLEFADADHLITSARSGGEQRAQVWTLSTGKLSKDVKIEGNLRGATLTSDGRYLALVVTNYGIVVYDVLKGPTRGKGKIAARIPITPLERRFIDVDGMRFSASGEEIAALCDNGARLLCWKKNTDLVFEHSLGSDLSEFLSGAMSYQGPAIEWAPGGRGWLLKGHTFLDRERRRVTWFLKTDHDSHARHRFIDDDRLLVVRGRGDDRELIDMKIPWKEIDDSFAAMKDPDVAAWLGPQAPAAVRVKVSSASDGTPTEQLASELTRLFAARMADDGLRIAESGAALFSIDYSETYQPPQTISSPVPSRLRISIPPRQIPGHTTCTMTIHFHANGNPIDLWTTTIHASAQDDPKVGQRSSVYAELGRKLQSAVLPIFIPKDKNLVALPAVIRP